MLPNHPSTTVELQDMGKFDSAWSGILSPVYDRSLVRKYIQDQFWEQANDYVERFQATEYWNHLLQTAQRYFTLESTKPLSILDLGSGAGNTIFPLMDLYPTSLIVATDLSLPLLKALKEYHEQYYPQHSCYVMQLNAEEMIFDSNQFDLVVGGAILHHLFAPEKTLAQCYHILKPNGIALFFEPFETGNQAIAMILKQLMMLNDRRKRRIPEKAINFFKSLCLDFQTRRGTDKTKPIFQQMDDKWLFTKAYFEEIAVRSSFRELVIYPLNNTENQFLNQIMSYLRLGLNVEGNVLPQWALDHIREMDELFSLESHGELIIEGGIILMK